jgi:dUTP pyrophosphatase
MVGTGIYVKIPVGWVGLLVPRSGLSKRGITMTNSIGIIDADYRGEIIASLVYDSLADTIAIDQVIERGERIVQLVVLPCPTLSMLIWNGDSEWNDTDRGFGGFGSTGVK